MTFAAMALMSMPASAHEFMAGKIKIVHPWTRVPPPAAKLGAGFVTLTNTGTETDRLIGGTAVDIGRVEVHEMSMAGGVMKMRQLENGIEIKPGATVELRPGGYHIMLLDIAKAPKAGEALKGTLSFEKAGTVEITYTVEPLGAKTSGERDHGVASKPAPKGSGSGSGSGSGQGGVSKNAQ